MARPQPPTPSRRRLFQHSRNSQSRHYSVPTWYRNRPEPKPGVVHHPTMLFVQPSQRTPGQPVAAFSRYSKKQTMHPIPMPQSPTPCLPCRMHHLADSKETDRTPLGPPPRLTWESPTSLGRRGRERKKKKKKNARHKNTVNTTITPTSPALMPAMTLLAGAGFRTSFQRAAGGAGS